MSSTLTTFLFELANFLLLAALLGWLLFKPVRAMLEARRAAEKKRADDLATRAAETERLRAEWQQRHAAFEAELEQTRSARQAAAAQEAAAIVAKAREAAERERDRATKTLAHVERAQLEMLAEAIADASRDAVARLLAAIDGADLDTSLVRAACHQLQALDPTSLGTVLVETARPLGEQGRAALEAALGARLVSTAFHVVPELGAGVRVTTARGLVDASAAGLAADVGRRLSDRLVTEEWTVTS